MLRNKENTWYFEESLLLPSSFFPPSEPESQQQVDKEEEAKESQMVAPFFSCGDERTLLWYIILSSSLSSLSSPLYCIGGRNTSILPLHLLLLFWYYIHPFAQSLFRQKWLEGRGEKRVSARIFFYTFVCIGCSRQPLPQQQKHRACFVPPPPAKQQPATTSNLKRIFCRPLGEFGSEFS